MKKMMILLALACAVSCMTVPPQTARNEKMNIVGESLVLAKTDPGVLCFDGVVKGSVTLRSTFVAGKAGGIVYTEGSDFVVDYAKGTIARTAGSRIPDYSTNVMYGLKDFDHTKLKEFTNHPWFVWADYQTIHGTPFAQPNDQSAYLVNVRKKLEAGGPFLIATYGDSITAGGEASEPDLRFQARYAKYLQAKFPKAQIEVKDVSIPGYASKDALSLFDKYIGTVEKPDLVLVGFGMNDHNIRCVEPDKYEENLVTLTNMIRERKGADVILFSTFPPNENWHYGTHRMALYAAAAKQAASKTHCAYVDVYSTWDMVLQRKDQSSLLGNNINHPNDFGHWLYEQAFEAMVMDSRP
ncbi:MAG: SGNH/GDSL hydrolase family protein [Candidatus Hydrogenedentes bacterium]|nr:SGNH/GDSL hydrolase family protein [Candidatus Hydrogenedentota bacterium]